VFVAPWVGRNVERIEAPTPNEKKTGARYRKIMHCARRKKGKAAFRSHDRTLVDFAALLLFHGTIQARIAPLRNGLRS
jgi:hypothetical protein